MTNRTRQILIRSRLRQTNCLKRVVLALFRVYKGLPKHGPLIRYLSEEGIKQLMLKVEAKYMQDNNREMPKAVEPLFFVIDEKNHSIELTDKGIEVLSGTTKDPDFFILPDIAAQLSTIGNEPIYGRRETG